MTDQLPPGHAAYHRVIDATNDALAVDEATGLVDRMVHNWSEASPAYRKELWADAAHANQALGDRWQERIDAARAERLPDITDGITDAEAEASATFDLTIHEVRAGMMP